MWNILLILFTLITCLNDNILDIWDLKIYYTTINVTSFYFFNVAIWKFKIMYVACVIFLLDSTVLTPYNVPITELGAQRFAGI